VPERQQELDDEVVLVLAAAVVGIDGEACVALAEQHSFDERVEQ
jgi:predicted DsbA family dithiol-disulfide isomerase